MWLWAGHLITLKFIISQEMFLNVSSTPAVLWISFLKILKVILLSFQRYLFLSISIKPFCDTFFFLFFPFDHILSTHPEELWSIFPFILLTTPNGWPLLCAISQYSVFKGIFIPSTPDKAYWDPDSTQRNVPAFRVSRHR